MTRYFFISYNFVVSNGFGFGSMGRIQKDGKYPVSGELQQSIINEDNEMTSVVILSIQEMEEDDFKQYFSESL